MTQESETVRGNDYDAALAEWLQKQIALRDWNASDLFVHIRNAVPGSREWLTSVPQLAKMIAGKASLTWGMANDVLDAFGIAIAELPSTEEVESVAGSIRGSFTLLAVSDGREPRPDGWRGPCQRNRHKQDTGARTRATDPEEVSGVVLERSELLVRAS